MDGAGLCEQRLDEIQVAHGDAAGGQQDVRARPGRRAAVPPVAGGRRRRCRGRSLLRRRRPLPPATSAGCCRESGPAARARPGSTSSSPVERTATRRPRMDGDLSLADGGEQPDLGRAQAVRRPAGRRRPLGTSNPTGRTSAPGCTRVRIRTRGGLPPGSGSVSSTMTTASAPLRQRCARGDVGDRARPNGELGDAACGHLADDGIDTRPVGSHHGIAVLHRRGKGGQRVGGGHVGGEDVLRRPGPAARRRLATAPACARTISRAVGTASNGYE